MPLTCRQSGHHHALYMVTLLLQLASAEDGAAESSATTAAATMRWQNTFMARLCVGSPHAQGPPGKERRSLVRISLQQSQLNQDASLNNRPAPWRDFPWGSS